MSILSPRILAALAAALSVLTKLRLVVITAKVAGFILGLAAVHPEALAAALLAAVSLAITILAALIVRVLMRDRRSIYPRTRTT